MMKESMKELGKSQTGRQEVYEGISIKTSVKNIKENETISKKLRMQWYSCFPPRGLPLPVHNWVIFHPLLEVDEFEGHQILTVSLLFTVLL